MIEEKDEIKEVKKAIFEIDPEFYNQTKRWVLVERSKRIALKCFLENKEEDENIKIIRNFLNSIDKLHSFPQPHILSDENMFRTNGGEKRDVHESYGQLMFNKCQGGYPNLYGSSISHSEKVTLEISISEKYRSLNHDSFFSKRRLIEIEMSESQFSSAITSFGCGGGVPVTIRYFDGKRMEPCPEISKRQEFQDEFENLISKLSEGVKKLEDESVSILKKKGSLKVSEREEVVRNITSLIGKLTSTVPFMSKMFNEQMDKTVTEVKCEIESIFDSKIQSLGLEEFKKQIKESFGNGDISIENKRNFKKIK